MRCDVRLNAKTEEQELEGRNRDQYDLQKHLHRYPINSPSRFSNARRILHPLFFLRDTDSASVDCDNAFNHECERNV